MPLACQLASSVATALAPPVSAERHSACKEMLENIFIYSVESFAAHVQDGTTPHKAAGDPWRGRLGIVASWNAPLKALLAVVTAKKIVLMHSIEIE